MSSRKSRKRAVAIILIDVLAFVILSAVIFWMTGFLNMFFARIGLNIVLPVPGEEDVVAVAHVREPPAPTEEPTPEPTEVPTPSPTLVAPVTPEPPAVPEETAVPEYQDESSVVVSS